MQIERTPPSLYHARIYVRYMLHGPLVFGEGSLLQIYTVFRCSNNQFLTQPVAAYCDMGYQHEVQKGAQFSTSA